MTMTEQLICAECGDPVTRKRDGLLLHSLFEQHAYQHTAVVLQQELPALGDWIDVVRTRNGSGAVGRWTWTGVVTSVGWMVREPQNMGYVRITDADTGRDEHLALDAYTTWRLVTEGEPHGPGCDGPLNCTCPPVCGSCGMPVLELDGQLLCDGQDYPDHRPVLVAPEQVG